MDAGIFKRSSSGILRFSHWPSTMPRQARASTCTAVNFQVGTMKIYCTATSGIDFDRRAVRYQPTNLFDLGVGDRDTAFGPIGKPMRRSDRTLAIGEAMNHDVPAWTHARPLRPRAI